MNRLKELRLAHGFKNQKELAAILYVNQTAVSQWERGVTIPSSPMLLKLSELYGVSVDYLLGRDEKKEPTPEPEDGQTYNVIQIAGRDGSHVERKLTDEQVAALKLIIDQLPDAENL